MDDSNPEEEKRSQRSRKKKAPKKITERYLRNSGAFYLQRFTASSGHFKSVMSRKIKKSCHYHKDQNYEECLTLLDKVTTDFLDQGLLDDKGYVRGMITSLRRSGKSQKAIFAKLLQKHVPSHDIEAALESFNAENNEDAKEIEFFAALKFARKKRLGPYDERKKWEENKALNTFARNGFGFDTARRVMNLTDDELYDYEHQIRL